MADESGAGAASTSAVHPYHDEFELRVAPAGPEGRNTLRLAYVPVACWRMAHAYFAYKSSLILPDVAADLAQLELRLTMHPGSPAAIFGHADPVGDDEYNKTLSGRRAASLYGLLTRDVELWESLYTSAAAAGDEWGLRSVQFMLGQVPAAGGAPYLAGTPSGYADGATDRAVRAFQGDRGLEVDGSAGPLTRKALYRVYMDAICLPGRALIMTPDRFLGAGADPGLRGACQGCSEFNPVVLLSREEESRFAQAQDKSERNAINAPNRRTLMLLFRAGTVLGPGWPCPGWKDRAPGCRKSFWPDGDTRRKPGEARREYRTDRRTMACRFYDRLSAVSPCEGFVEETIAYWDPQREVEPEPAEVEDQSANPDWENGLAPPEDI